jgi:hypothetical protein
VEGDAAGDGAEFAFVTVCDVLGIDAQRLRGRLRERTAEKQAA